MFQIADCGGVLTPIGEIVGRVVADLLSNSRRIRGEIAIDRSARDEGPHAAVVDLELSAEREFQDRLAVRAEQLGRLSE